MKKSLFLFLLFTFSLCSYGASFEYQKNMVTTQQVLISAPQTITDAWVDMGTPQNVLQFTHFTLWVALNINDSLNVRFRMLMTHTANGTEYQRIIQTPAPSGITFEPAYLELNTDGADINFVESFPIHGVYYVQVQVMAGTVGSTAGIVTTSNYTLLSR